MKKYFIRSSVDISYKRPKMAESSIYFWSTDIPTSSIVYFIPITDTTTIYKSQFGINDVLKAVEKGLMREVEDSEVALMIGFLP